MARCGRSRDRAFDSASGAVARAGARSARRAALHLVKKKEQLLDPRCVAAETRDSILTCETCGNIDTQSPARLQVIRPATARSSASWRRSASLALERAVVNGLYHVLGGTLSLLDGVGPDDLTEADRARERSGGHRGSSGAERDRGRSVGALPHRPAGRLQRHRVAARPRRAHRRRTRLSRRGHVGLPSKRGRRWAARTSPWALLRRSWKPRRPHSKVRP